ncbi:MAG TPA: metallopeptidase TldD-related protein [candidate division Zixibacteria bacterium]|nr:metallopeptidase TldD-related protein [candidate division Zixibacteria bacterium]
MANQTRRDFLVTSAKGIALASIPFFLRIDPARAFGIPDADRLSGYLDHFGVTEATIREIMATALEKGGDYCDLYFEHTISNWVGLEDDSVNRAYANVDFGVGIRVIEGDQTGYSYTEEITPAAMKLAAQTAANIASDSRTAPPAKVSLHDIPNYYPVKTAWEDVGIDRKMPFLTRLNEHMKTEDTRLIKTKVWFNDETKYIMAATSDGRIVCDYQPMVTIHASCTAEQDGKVESGGRSFASRSGLECLTDATIDRVAREAVERTTRLFTAVKPPAGEMPVILAAGASGILLHEAIGHGMEADFNRKGESIFSDKIGKPVAEKFVSIVDDGTTVAERGSINCDDEGNDSQKNYLVQDGILTTYMHDRISARHYQVKSTGNGRRQSFRFPPLPRMTNTYMPPGPHTRDEIIASTKSGILAEAFTNGEVRIGPGDFTFYVASGRLIENGKLTSSIKDVNIIGNGPDVLTKVTMVADDFEIDNGVWTCGKGGQSVPVSLGLPTVKVSSITVGGIAG